MSDPTPAPAPEPTPPPAPAPEPTPPPAPAPAPAPAEEEPEAAPEEPEEHPLDELLRLLHLSGTAAEVATVEEWAARRLGIEPRTPAPEDAPAP